MSAEERVATPASHRIGEPGLLETVPGVVWEMSPQEGRFLFVSNRAPRLTGHSRETWLAPEFWSTQVHPEDRDDVLAQRQAAWRAGVDVALRYRFRHADGRYLWLREGCSTAVDSQGALTLCGTLVDITDSVTAREVAAGKTTAEARYAQVHAELDAVIEVIDDVIVRADPQGRVAWWNAALVRITGRSAESLGGLPVMGLFIEEDRPSVAEHVALLQAHGRCTLDARLMTPGGPRPFQFSCVARRDASGQVIELVGLGRDVSELRDKEYQLLQAQKMDVLGHFVDGIAHDFNNILASTLGYSTLCLSKLKDRPQDKLVAYLEEIKKASQRGRDLVTQMLAFGRGSPGDPKVIDPAVLVQETLTMLRPILPTSIEMRREIQGDLPHIRIDPVNLHQIVMNLCVNARDAMGSHRGSITVSLARREYWGDSCASCQSFFSGEFLEIAVADSGCGIPAEIVTRLFDPFFSTKDIGKGTGMGLAVVHGIVHERGGHILLETSPAGTTFRILLPPVLGEGAAEAEHAEDAADAIPSGGETLLVVEDDPIILHLYTVALQGAGYRVMSFKHPAEALEWIGAHPFEPAMMLTDYTMPGMSGARLTEAVHRLRPDLPAVMLTAEGEYLLSDDDMARAGVERVYRKPITISGLLEAIRNLLDKHRKE